MKKVTKFEADDGSLFNTESDCIMYEHDKMRHDLIVDRISHLWEENDAEDIGPNMIAACLVVDLIK